MLEEIIVTALKEVTKASEIQLDVPEISAHGDYSSNVALVLAKEKDENPKELAQRFVDELIKDESLKTLISKIEVAGPGFINFFISDRGLFEINKKALTDDNFGKSDMLSSKKIMVEYAHPNTHKELHIGHMRTLILGESLSRIFEAVGAEVFRANYQGDIGPHVAKSIWGTQQILNERKLAWDAAEKMTSSEKAHLLGEGYVLGVSKYEEDEAKSEIDAINSKLYRKDPDLMLVYERTRNWSLEYYDTFYKRFNTKFDRLYFESGVNEDGKKIVEDNIGKVFKESEEAVVFPGEEYGLHTRVFITKDGNPTYEAKDMALAPLQYSEFAFDTCLHVVANEQKGYFQVIIKALELIDSKFEGREYHLPMGMVNLVGKKMSSRTGEILRVDELIEEVKKEIMPLVEINISGAEKEGTAEMITIGAIKYSMLRSAPTSDILFDIKESVSLEGNSGPYIQYTNARALSVIEKSGRGSGDYNFDNMPEITDTERDLLRTFAQYEGVIVNAAKSYSPNLIANYIYDLAQKYNTFYNKEKIIGSDKEEFRVMLSYATSNILQSGLGLLGIDAPERM